MHNLIQEIPVTFGPHDADWALVSLTALSVAASAFLGWLAYENGKRATDIAEEAVKRDREFREAESERREYAERYSAASAMAKAFWALEAAILHDQGGRDPEGVLIATRNANALKFDAIVEIELLNPKEFPVEIIDWFEDTWKRMGHLEDRPAEREPYRGEALGSIRRWKNRIVTVKDFLDPGRSLL